MDEHPIIPGMTGTGLGHNLNHCYRTVQDGRDLRKTVAYMTRGLKSAFQ